MDSRRRTTLALASLAAAAFVFVTSELQPVALLPEISAGLGVGEGSVGLLMTIYAAVAGATAIPLTAWSTRIPRRRLLLGTMAVLVVSQAAATVAPTFAVLAAARVACALAHGVFWSIIARVAASLVGSGGAGRATAAVFAGNSLALVAGAPLVSAIGSALGWRDALGTVGAAAALAGLALWRLLPEAGETPRATSAREVGALLLHPRLLAVCGVTLTLVIGHFTAYTYFVPIVRDHTGLSGTGLSAALLAYGAAGVAGIALVGAVTDRRPRLALLASCAAVTVALVALAVVTRSTPLTFVAVVAWGAGFTAVPVCLQTAVLRVVPESPDTGSAIYVVAFQIGIGGGALLGALLLAAAGTTGVVHVGLALLVLGTVAAAAARSAFGARPPVAASG